MIPYRMMKAASQKEGGSLKRFYRGSLLVLAHHKGAMLIVDNREGANRFPKWMANLTLQAEGWEFYDFESLRVQVAR